MALFKKDWNKPGPGVPKDAPPKKGLARFWEVLVRDGGNLLKINLLVQLCYLPSQIFLLLAVLSLAYLQGQGMLLAGLLAFLCSVPVGPARCAESYVISKMLRDDPGFVWHDFKKAFKENFKASVLLGMLFSLVTGIQVLAFLYYQMLGGVSLITLIGLFLSVLLFAIVVPYYYLQAVYVDLKFFPLLKNSMLLALGNAPRSLAGGILALVLVGLQWFVFPFAVVVTFIWGYALPTLVNLMWIWPVVDKTFKIDATLKERAAEKLESEEEAENMEEPLSGKDEE